jgi:ABC-type multidrug transport system ATPase subunit
MGASGAGKTSLLNVISDRASKKNGTEFSGKILINNEHTVKQ